MIELNGVEYKAISNLYLKDKKGEIFIASPPLDMTFKKHKDTNEYYLYLRYSNFHDTFEYSKYSILFFVQDLDDCLWSYYTKEITKYTGKTDDSYDTGYKFYYKVEEDPITKSVFDIYQSSQPISNMIE